MLSKIFTTAALAAALVSAQTHSDCDPTKKTGCKPDPAVAGTVSVDFTKGANDFFTVAQGTSLTYDDKLGAAFTINKETDAPTISSAKYIFFGKVDVVVRAAVGTGIVTSFVLQSDDLDEIDWEWLGGDTTQVQTNYFSKGCTDTYTRGGFSNVNNPQSEFYTYTIEWTPTKLVWSINGSPVRTLEADKATGCDGFPQTPMQVKLGTWVGGSSTASPGTVQWAGGKTNFASAPFIGYYQSVTITDYQGGSAPATGASEYVYGDQTGTWQSIKINTGGNSSSNSDSTPSSSNGSSNPSTSGSNSGTPASSAPTTMVTATTAGQYANATTTGGSSNSGATAAVTTSSSASASASSAKTAGAGKASFSVATVAVMGAALIAMAL